jgi:hypothetical protein
MSNQIDNSIIYRLPRELQIQCLQFLSIRIPNERLLVVGNNERLLIVGSNDNDKTTFINLLRRATQPKKLPLLNKPKTFYNIKEKTIKKTINNFNIKPTKIIILSDVTSYSYEYYIPFYKYLNIPFIVFKKKLSSFHYQSSLLNKTILNDDIEIIHHRGFESNQFYFNNIESILFDKNDYEKYKILKQKYKFYF